MGWLKDLGNTLNPFNDKGYLGDAGLGLGLSIPNAWDAVTGGIGNAWNGLTNRETENINPYTATTWQQAQDELSRRQGQYDTAQRRQAGVNTSAQDATTQFGSQAAAANAFNNPASGMYGPYAGYVGSGANYGQPGVQSAYNAAGGLTDDAGLNAYMAYSPAMQQIAFGQFSPMQQMLNAQAADQARLATQNTGQQFAQRGAFNSGAAAAAMAEAGARPFAQVQNQLGMQQAQLGGQLQGQLLGATTQNAQQRAGLGVQAGQLDLQRMLANRDAANQMSRFNTQLGYQQALDQARLAAQMQQQAFDASQSYGNPQFQQQPSVLDEIGQIASIGGDIAGTIMAFA